MQLVRSADGHVVTVTLPGATLTPAVARALSRAATDLVEDREVRVVVLRATAPFCTGPSAELTTDAVDPDPASALARLRVPIVAVVEGRCASVGLEILLACDIRIASTDASFVVDDVQQGRLPGWGGTQRLPRAVGHARATWLLLTGAELDASMADRWGLVHEVSDNVEASLDTVLEQLAATGPLATEFAKEAVHRGSELPLRDGLRLEGDLNHQLAATEDRAEGLQAFFDKRPPDFAGR